MASSEVVVSLKTMVGAEGRGHAIASEDCRELALLLFDKLLAIVDAVFIGWIGC